MTAELELIQTERSAELSADGIYRYTLYERWSPGRLCVFSLCNPSHAYALREDQTDRVTTGFAKRWGCGGKLIVNPCAFRSPRPRDLLTAADPVGPENRAWLERVFRDAFRDKSLVVFGWGLALPKKLRVRAMEMDALARSLGVQPMCLGLTADGQPKHPLMISYETRLVPFEARS